jgi:hypothetical protein
MIEAFHMESKQTSMLQVKYTGDALWARIERAVEKVKQRLERASRLLESAGIPYAVIGGNAVQAWVAQVDEAAVRNTQDVDILLNRVDLPGATRALSTGGFHFAEVHGVPMFLDGPDASPRDAVHIVYAEEKVAPSDLEPAPSVDDCQRIKDFRMLALPALVRMKLTSFRLKDRVHLLDMISLGMIDASWLDGLSPDLRRRLQELLDNPNA